MQLFTACVHTLTEQYVKFNWHRSILLGLFANRRLKYLNNNLEYTIALILKLKIIHISQTAYILY